MSKHDEIMERGRVIALTDGKTKGYTYCSRVFADPSSPLPPAYILVEDRFTTGHDDSATFVELIDKNENIIQSWKFEGPLKKHFEDPDFWDDDCLVYYLKETLGCKVVRNGWA